MLTLLKQITLQGKLIWFWKYYVNNVNLHFSVNSNASSDLLGLSTPPATQSQTGTLIDVLGDIYSTTNGTGTVINNAKKYGHVKYQHFPELQV